MRLYRSIVAILYRLECCFVLVAKKESPRSSRPSWFPPLQELLVGSAAPNHGLHAYQCLAPHHESFTQTSNGGSSLAMRLQRQVLPRLPRYACMVLAWLHRSFNLTPNSRTALAGSDGWIAHSRTPCTRCSVYKILKWAHLQFSSPVTPFTSNHLFYNNQSLAAFSSLQNDQIIAPHQVLLYSKALIQTTPTRCFLNKSSSLSSQPSPSLPSRLTSTSAPTPLPW